MKTEKQNKGYDYLTSRINAFLLKGYSSVWQQVFFHTVFWILICSFDVIMALFKWPEGIIPAKYFILFFIGKLPSVILFYLIFYFKRLQPLFLRFLIGVVIYYVTTHWVQLYGLYLTIQDEVLINSSKTFVRTFKDIGLLDFFSLQVISGNLYTMVFGFLPLSIKFVKDLYVTSLQKQILEVESTRAELNYLRNQINPHFIFNTINNAYYYIFKKDQESAELLLKLANIIRYTIEETGGNLIPIEKEINMIHDLLSIEKIRSSTHASLTYIEELEMPDISMLRVLPLSFVTLLENAIKYGVGTNEKNGFVNCTLKVTKGQIDFSVINSINIRKADNSTGIGLNNLKRRLDLLYGDNYNLNLHKQEHEYLAHLRISII